MRFGALSTVDAYPDREQTDERPAHALRLVPVAERLGFDSFWITEHHFQLGGTVPSPPVWLAAAAQRSRRLRLGPLVAVLPLHDPRSLAEEYALVDRLSGGRLEIGVGAGYVAREFDGFGRRIGERHASLDAGLREFRSALRGEPLPCSSNPGRTVRINVRPVQQPHPPIWRAAAHHAHIRRVGEDGDGLALIPYATLGDLRELEGPISVYREALPPAAMPRVLAAFHIYVGPRVESAERALQRFVDTRPPVGDDSPGAAGSGLRPLRATSLRDSGLALVGSGPELEEPLERIRRAGVTDLIGIFDFGGLEFSEVVASMQRWQELVRSQVGGEPFSGSVLPTTPASLRAPGEPSAPVGN